MSTRLATSSFERAHGALIGLAIGDALGMPSQTLTVTQIQSHYGWISGFVAPFEDHPVSHGLRAGQVTDDTEQALILASHLISGQGTINQTELAKDLLKWESDVKARGLRDLLGPSSKAALDALLAGAPIAEIGRNGTTNGAAMRITPVGIAVRVEPLAEFVDQVECACRLTHNTGEAIASAAAVAAVISCGLEGGSFDEAIPTALRAAKEGQERGFAVGNQNIEGRIVHALSVARMSGATAKDISERIGTSVASHESVAATFGLLRLADGDLWQAALMAANIGDDTDTIGAISCAMAGACSGVSAIPDAAIAVVTGVNDLPLRKTAEDLLQLREAGRAENQIREASQ